MLAEVNAHYDLRAPAVPFREVATENWYFASIGSIGLVK
jgi:hypothetical protein